MRSHPGPLTVLAGLTAVLATGLAAAPAQASPAPPDPPLGPAPPSPVPLSDGPPWHQAVRWMLAGALRTSSIAISSCKSLPSSTNKL